LIAPMIGKHGSASGVARAAYSYRNDPAVPKFRDDRAVIVFDGYCALCSGWVSFILRHDRHAIFSLLPAQSPIGRALYVHYRLDPQDYETYILVSDGVAWLKSEATIRMMQSLGFPWSLARVFRLVPRPWRDRLYALVARNRFRVFGRRATCYRPDPRYEDRFLQ
jgi:predicted DCC family thiol-disulfide oxidoreductase YuxK